MMRITRMVGSKNDEQVARLLRCPVGTVKAAVTGPLPAASTALPARLGPGRGPISMGMIYHTDENLKWRDYLENCNVATESRHY
jgi:hypothetical protein